MNSLPILSAHKNEEQDVNLDNALLREAQPPLNTFGLLNPIPEELYQESTNPLQEFKIEKIKRKSIIEKNLDYTKRVPPTHGSRKQAHGFVELIPGEKGLSINNRDGVEYLLSNPFWLSHCFSPLEAVHLENYYKIVANVRGGGLGGQSGAISIAVAKEICRLRPEFQPTLSQLGFLKTDSRKVERKKFGLRKARKTRQYRKR